MAERDWNGSNILEVVADFVNEKGVPEEEKRIEFITGTPTFCVLKSTIAKNLERFKNSSIWSRSLSESFLQVKIVAVPILRDKQNYSFAALDLSAKEMNIVSSILILEMMEQKDESKRGILEKTLKAVNTDFQLAGGMVVPEYRDFKGM